ncbi:proline-rich protein 36-like [Bacillus rossius redtenbacheri]|uniref:proline-rich protein 36-like n=1 Tax=Bacillus rossius redtenbacheri TaxID=93214 RepID=UPI002FDC8B48
MSPVCPAELHTRPHDHRAGEHRGLCLLAAGARGPPSSPPSRAPVPPHSTPGGAVMVGPSTSGAPPDAAESAIPSVGPPLSRLIRGERSLGTSGVPMLPRRMVRPLVYSQPRVVPSVGAYIVMLPVPPRRRLQCPECPVGSRGMARPVGEFSAWPALAKHLRRYHPGLRQFRARFGCRHCGRAFDSLKQANLHTRYCQHLRELMPSPTPPRHHREETTTPTIRMLTTLSSRPRMTIPGTRAWRPACHHYPRCPVSVLCARPPEQSPPSGSPRSRDCVRVTAGWHGDAAALPTSSGEPTGGSPVGPDMHPASSPVRPATPVAAGYPPPQGPQRLDFHRRLVVLPSGAVCVMAPLEEPPHHLCPVPGPVTSAVMHLGDTADAPAGPPRAHPPLWTLPKPWRLDVCAGPPGLTQPPSPPELATPRCLSTSAPRPDLPVSLGGVPVLPPTPPPPPRPHRLKRRLLATRREEPGANAARDTSEEVQLPLPESTVLEMVALVHAPPAEAGSPPLLRGSVPGRRALGAGDACSPSVRPRMPGNPAPHGYGDRVDNLDAMTLVPDPPPGSSLMPHDRWAPASAQAPIDTPAHPVSAATAPRDAPPRAPIAPLRESRAPCTYLRGFRPWRPRRPSWLSAGVLDPNTLGLPLPPTPAPREPPITQEASTQTRGSAPPQNDAPTASPTAGGGALPGGPGEARERRRRVRGRVTTVTVHPLLRSAGGPTCRDRAVIPPNLVAMIRVAALANLLLRDALALTPPPQMVAAVIRQSTR